MRDEKSFYSNPYREHDCTKDYLYKSQRRARQALDKLQRKERTLTLSVDYCANFCATRANCAPWCLAKSSSYLVGSLLPSPLAIVPHPYGDPP